MSNADQIKYLKMEEQIEKRKSIAANAHDLILTFPPQPTLQVNAQGEIIFDEASLGLLDEHIRKVVRQEVEAMKKALFKEFEQHLANRIRMHGGYGNV